jgi:hypothetical protein
MRRVEVVTVDDLTGEPATEVVTFGFEVSGISWI